MAFFGAGSVMLWFTTLDIPDFRSFNQDRLITESTKIYDRTGKIVLYSLHENVERQVVDFDHISRFVKNATVAIEDDQFYEHYGVKPMAILRAFFVNLGTASFRQGGSTITQQLIKNSVLTQDKKISRKIKELVLSIKVEQVLSKEEILTLYLNETPYGGNLYGIEEASRSFFGKAAADLNLVESSYLAAIPKAPTFYSPYGNNRDKLEERKNLVLERMLALNFITAEEKTAAQQTKITFQPAADRGIKAPHFVLWVRDYLEEKYGPDVVRRRGLKITTTLDWEWQKKAEAVIREFAPGNEEKFRAKNAGMVVIDPKTGDILAMVGSRDYFETENDGNFNITLAHRQPGSAFKPFVYATAFNKSYTPETVLFDLETQFDTNCDTDPTRCYTPGNYDNNFRGPMTLRQALAQSINIPSIKALYLAGIRDSIETATAMGIENLGDANQYGLPLVLGGGEVSLLDMVSAYGVFANDGVRHPYRRLLKVEDNDGRVLEESAISGRRVLPENTARLISDILSDNAARSPTFGENSLLHFPGRDVAVKTGTTNDYRDTWIIGYTPEVAVGAWVGNNDNTPLEKKVAGLIVAPLWNSFFRQIMPELADERFPDPLPARKDIKPVLRGIWQGGENYFVDQSSGKLATDYTPPELRQEKVVPAVHSILYWLDKNNLHGPRPSNPELDPQFKLWEEPVRRWAAARGLTDSTLAVAPSTEDDVHRPEYRPVLSISGPTGPQTKDQVISVEVRAESRFPLAQVDFFLNNSFLGSATAAPFKISFRPSTIEHLATNNELRAVGYDQVRNQGEAKMTLEIRE